MEIASHKNWATTGANADFRQEVEERLGEESLLQQFWLKPPTENPGDEPRANVCCLGSVCFSVASVHYCIRFLSNSVRPVSLSDLV
jgi:hypothetical protein